MLSPHLSRRRVGNTVCEPNLCHYSREKVDANGLQRLVCRGGGRERGGGRGGVGVGGRGGGEKGGGGGGGNNSGTVD